MKRFFALVAPSDALGGHEPGHLVPADVHAGPLGRLPELAAAVDRVVGFHSATSLGPSHGVTHGPGRGRPGLGVVVGGGGDLELLADRLDPPSTPTGLRVPVGVDEGDYFFPSAVELRPEESRCGLQDVVGPAQLLDLLAQLVQLVVLGRWSAPVRRPASISACLTHRRSDSAPTPSWRATRVITPWSPGSSQRSSWTMRTARSFSSGGYLFDAVASCP